MPSKVAVVTGSNKGIGFATVRALCAKFNGDVILTSRDETRGKNAVKQLEKEGLKPKFHLLNISSTSSIKSLELFLKEKYGGLDVLVNNAAIAYLDANTPSFLEQAKNTIQVNFFDTLNVCNQLFPLLRPHARVVNLSSSAGKLSRIPNKDLQQKFLSENLTIEELKQLMLQFINDVENNVHEENGWGNSAYVPYIVSKVGVTALTFIQHREFLKDDREDIVVNAVHPGYVDTDMTRNRGHPLTPDQGAEVPVYCALLPPNIKSPRGEFVWSDKSVVSWL